MGSSIIILLATFIFFLAINVPIALAIGLSTALSMIITVPIIPALTTIAQQMATGINSFALLAIPFFGQSILSTIIYSSIIEGLYKVFNPSF